MSSTTTTSTNSLKPITIYGKNGPNPPKVRIVCEELNLPYEIRDVQFADLKKPDFLAINPNGRMPAIHDPNTEITLWESGAIIEYLVQTYDVEHKLGFEHGSKEEWHARQWLFFQVSGQGPYFGQAIWFTKFHPEEVLSARERYYAEIKRVTSVLEGHLKSQEQGSDGPWLVGSRYSYADLALFPWYNMLQRHFEGLVDLSEFTVFQDWMQRLTTKKGVKVFIEDA